LFGPAPQVSQRVLSYQREIADAISDPAIERLTKRQIADKIHPSSGYREADPHRLDQRPFLALLPT
jgi:hypothetical protein